MLEFENNLTRKGKVVLGRGFREARFVHTWHLSDVCMQFSHSDGSYHIRLGGHTGTEQVAFKSMTTILF